MKMCGVKKQGYFSITLILVGIMLIGGCSPKNAIEIVINESFYSSFIVEGEKVYIECELMIKNSTGEDAIVEFYADFPDDVDLGLLEKSRLKGYQENREVSEFSLLEGETRIRVVFIGDFAGTNLKHDRNMPNITIEQKQSVKG